MTDYEADKDAPELCDMANFTIIPADDPFHADPDYIFAYGIEN